MSFEFLYNFFLNISHSKKNWERYNYKSILFFMWSTRYSCPILVELYSSSKGLQKFSNTEFQENPPRGSRVVLYIDECHWQKAGIWDLKKDWTNWQQKRASCVSNEHRETCKHLCLVHYFGRSWYFIFRPANACSPCHYHSIYSTENEEMEWYSNL